MKQFIVFLAFLTAFGTTRADLVFHGEGVAIRLGSQPCTHPAVLAQIPVDKHHLFQAGEAVLAGQPVSLCWMAHGPGIYFVDQDGSHVRAHRDVFRQAPAT